MVIRLLPFILIPVLFIAGLGYWRYSATKQSPVTPQTGESQTLVEVPKTLPNASVEDRVKALEDLVTKLVSQTPPTAQSGATSSNSRLSDAESAVTELKARVSALEKATPTSVSTSSQFPTYIPMGSTAGPWISTDWQIVSEYEVSIDPGSYPGYSGMNLEVNFRMIDTSSTGSVRLYNSTDSSAVSAQVDSNSSTFSLKTSGTFKLSGGKKTYTLQVKSPAGKELFVQSARIKVNF